MEVVEQQITYCCLCWGLRVLDIRESSDVRVALPASWLKPHSYTFNFKQVYIVCNWLFAPFFWKCFSVQESKFTRSYLEGVKMFYICLWFKLVCGCHDLNGRICTCITFSFTLLQVRHIFVCWKILFADKVTDSNGVEN